MRRPDHSPNARAKLKVKVIPGSSCSKISGWLGDMLKVRISAPPEKGKANAAVVDLLTKELGLPKGSLTIASGKTSPHKVIEIHGLTTIEVLQKLGASSLQQDVPAC